jgi:hypothetical protein
VLEKKNLSLRAGTETGAAGQGCPKCGAGRLFREQLSDGRAELICLNLDCDYLQIVSESEEKEQGVEEFVIRITRMTLEQLRAMQEKLIETCETLTGRSRRLAKQQLGVVQGELDRRAGAMENAGMKRSERIQEESVVSTNKMPPQFNTPEATARRLEGLRKYHRLKKAEQKKLESHMQSIPVMSARSTPWFERLLKTLRDEAIRHEQAARNYSRVPELFTLHIEHSARAFELNRVLDLLDNYADIMGGQNTAL